MILKMSVSDYEREIDAINSRLSQLVISGSTVSPESTTFGVFFFLFCLCLLVVVIYLLTQLRWKTI